MLTCPICHAPLRLEGRTFRCDERHAFDRAREGYVDLLPVGHGRSGITGDTAAMSRARRSFLSHGHYDPLVRRIVGRVLDHAARAVHGRAAAVGEAGCGVGHYIGAVGMRWRRTPRSSASTYRGTPCAWPPATTPA